MAEEQALNDVYKHYTAESINLAAQNKYIPIPFHEAIKPKRRDSRTAEEVVEDVMKNAGIKLVG